MAENKSLAKLMAETRRLADDEDARFELGERDAESAAPNTRTAPTASAPVEPPPAPAGKPARGDRVHTSIYLPRDVWRRLRAIAAAEDCKVHDLVMEGVAQVVVRREGRRSDRFTPVRSFRANVRHVSGQNCRTDPK